jgi:hypothetical protein
MRRGGFFRRNGLSVTLGVLFLLFFVGQALTGWVDFNEEQREHAQPTSTLAGYLASGDFLEVTAENWESEFLQMAAYLLLTIRLFQVGSSESKDPDAKEAVDRDPRLSRDPDAPSPVKRGGWRLAVYEHSLSIAFVALFLLSAALHAVGGARAYSEEQLAHGGRPVGALDYLTTARFWFESFQNWQSEFLALFAMVVLSIFLRQRGSPESKPVDAPHAQTGGD